MGWQIVHIISALALLGMMIVGFYFAYVIEGGCLG